MLEGLAGLSEQLDTLLKGSGGQPEEAPAAEAEAPAVAGPAVTPEAPGKTGTVAGDVRKGMGQLVEGLDASFEDKAREYADRITAGDDPKTMGVPEPLRARVSELVAQNRVAVPELKVPVAPEAPLSAEKQKSWQEAALEMAQDQFAAIGFRQTGNEIVAAAAFEFRAEIASGAMTREMFTAIMREINGIAKSYEAQLGRPTEQVLEWQEAAENMGGDDIAKTAFDTTGNRVVAAAAYRFRDGILRVEDRGASFKQMMQKVNGAVRKYKQEMEERKT